MRSVTDPDPRIVKASMDLLEAQPDLKSFLGPNSSNGAGWGQPNLIEQSFSDVGNADRFIAFCGARARYCHGFKGWLIYDERRWSIDAVEVARNLAKQTVLAFLRQAVEQRNEAAEKFARHSLDSKRITNMLREAQHELFIEVEKLDTDPFLLNFQNGTVNLRTGELRPHSPEDFITKLVHHNYRLEAMCPLFLATLAWAMGSHPDASEAEMIRAEHLVSSFQKCFGYSLTGSTSEKVVFILHGKGDNGKTTILSLFLKLLEEYSTLLQIDTLMVRQEGNNQQADLADLRGVRFAMTSETEEGQRLAEGKLKRITQGMGRIKATRKYENPITFPETHKLWMDANHKPVIRGQDRAIWNRLYLLPFNVTLSKDEIDRELPAKLLIEAQGVLAWAVAGAVRWTKEGLGRPKEVTSAVEDYRTQMDQIGQFVTECCVRLPNVKVLGKTLFEAYCRWADETRVSVVSRNIFRQRLLDDYDLDTQHTESGVTYQGIGLRVNDAR